MKVEQPQVPVCLKLQRPVLSIYSLSDSDIQNTDRCQDETIDRHLERCSQLFLPSKVNSLIDFFFHFKERKGIKGNFSYVLSEPNKVATTMNSKSVDRADYKSEGQRWKKHLSSGCVVVNSSSDVFFLIKTKESLPLKKKWYKGSKCNCRVGIKKSERFFPPLISIFES